MIEFKDVSKEFAGFYALRSISLKIRGGATTVLLGTSGCGKSTILKLILGLIDADNGEIFVENSPLDFPELETLRQKIGYVIQDGGLFPHLTARQNVCLMADHLGWDKARSDKRVRELCELTRLPVEILKKYPVQLSGGQRQRISLIRSLMLDPQIMLMDEPLGALDPITRADLQQDLRHIFKNLGKTVVMVTHDLGEAAYFGDEIVLLNEGKIIQRGSMTDLINKPADEFVTRFVNAQRSHI